MDTPEAALHRPLNAAKVVLVGNDYVTFRAYGSETSDAYSVIELTSKPGSSPPLHVHPFREVYLVLDGEYEFSWEVDGAIQTTRAGPGATVTIPPSLPHAFRNGGDRSARMLVVMVGGGFERFFEEVGGPVEKAGDDPVGYDPPATADFVAGFRRYGMDIARQPGARPA